jgi:hypothetical protein
MYPIPLTGLLIPTPSPVSNAGSPVDRGVTADVGDLPDRPGGPRPGHRLPARPDQPVR